jgi:hypothetical protein
MPSCWFLSCTVSIKNIWSLKSVCMNFHRTSVIWHKIRKFELNASCFEKAKKLISKFNENENLSCDSEDGGSFLLCYLFGGPKWPRKFFRGLSIAPCLAGPKGSYKVQQNVIANLQNNICITVRLFWLKLYHLSGWSLKEETNGCVTHCYILLFIFMFFCFCF